MAKKPTPNREFWESLKRNNYSYIKYYNKLMEYAISSFKWTGLPDSVDPRFLELCLFSKGCSIFYNDEALGYVSLRCTLGGQLNQYGIPQQRTAEAYNGFRNTDLNEENSVIIFNDMLHLNSMLVVEEFAQRLYEIDRTIDINAKAQKTPILLTCDEQEKLTIQNAYKQYIGNEPVIATSKGFRPESIKVLTTGAPYVADRLYTLKSQIWNEALTFLGIANVNFEKAERLISDEVTRSQGGVMASRFSKVQARQQACEQINKMFGLNVWCEFRDIDEDSTNINEQKDGESNEPIHDRTEEHL